MELDLNSVVPFSIVVGIVVAIALIITAATAGRWTVQWFMRNRQVRTAQHQSLGRYYGQLAFSH